MLALRILLQLTQDATAHSRNQQSQCRCLSVRYEILYLCQTPLGLTIVLERYFYDNMRLHITQGQATMVSWRSL